MDNPISNKDAINNKTIANSKIFITIFQYIYRLHGDRYIFVVTAFNPFSIDIINNPISFTYSPLNSIIYNK